MIGYLADINKIIQFGINWGLYCKENLSGAVQVDILGTTKKYIKIQVLKSSPNLGYILQFESHI